MEIRLLQKRRRFYSTLLFGTIGTICLLCMSTFLSKQHHDTNLYQQNNYENNSKFTTTSIKEESGQYHQHQLSPHSDKHTHFRDTYTPDPFDLNKANLPIINRSRHYSYLVIIASKASHISRRRLIRQSYFGLVDNLVPCMEYDTDVMYLFWIYGDLPSHSSEKYKYETEKMEWADMVEMPRGVDFEQQTVLEWVEKDLRQQQNITYDYLILQDIHTFVRLDAIKNELDSQVIGSNTYSPVVLYTEAPLNVIWGPMVGKNQDKLGLVIGHDAVLIALANAQHLVGPHSGQLTTDLKQHFDIVGDMLEAAIDSMLEPEASAAEQERMTPLFIQDKGDYGTTRRFIEWENNVESVSVMENVAISNVYQDDDFVALTSWTRMQVTPVCYATTNGYRHSHFITDTDDDEEKDDDTMITYDDIENNAQMIQELLYEQQQRLSSTTTQQLDDKKHRIVHPTIVIATSSFVDMDENKVIQDNDGNDDDGQCQENFTTAIRAATNKRNYALKHGYAFVARSAEFDQQSFVSQQRHLSWGKLDIVEKLLPKYQWVVWMDRDMVVMNNTRSIHDLISDLIDVYNKQQNRHLMETTFENDIDLIILTSPQPTNARLYLFRRSPWSMQFLRHVQLLSDDPSGTNNELEMDDIMLRLIQQRHDYRSRTLMSQQLDGTSPVLSSSSFTLIKDAFVVHYSEKQCLLSKGLDAAADWIHL
ncbi:uncharacterized protein BX664DRAFT_337672, partial [Halteromyces radiatus]|uniref:uncharacterized protein n=1 Tax=Halteromyces radiatus TaxID=101107 RepID=UPI0022207411